MKKPTLKQWMKAMRERGVCVVTTKFVFKKQKPTKFTPPRSLDLAAVLQANMLNDWSIELEMERQMLLDSYAALAKAHAKRMAELFDKEKVDRLSRKEK